MWCAQHSREAWTGHPAPVRPRRGERGAAEGWVRPCFGTGQQSKEGMGRCGNRSGVWALGHLRVLWVTVSHSSEIWFSAEKSGLTEHLWEDIPMRRFGSRTAWISEPYLPAFSEEGGRQRRVRTFPRIQPSACRAQRGLRRPA